MSLSAPTNYWHLDRLDELTLTYDGDYSACKKGYGVIVYVVDTPVRGSHREFNFSLSDADSDPRSRVTAGWSAWAPTIGDKVCGGTGTNAGHGTAVASVLGGLRFGAAAQVTIVPVAAFECTGNSSTSILLNAFEWIRGDSTPVAQDHNSPVNGRIVNMSFEIEVGSGYYGGTGSFDANDMTAIDLSIQQMITANFTVVAAAGNGNQDVGSAVTPARIPDVLTVAASTSGDGRWSQSNFGAKIDLFAPGDDVTSAHHTSDTAERPSGRSGTSFASPLVAGIAARFVQQYPGESPASITSRVLGAAQSVIQNPGVNTTTKLVYKGLERCRGTSL